MKLEDLAAREAVRETVVRLFVRTDQKDWAGVRECFADRVLFDMQSMTDEAPAELAADDIVAGWEQGLAPIDRLHHQAGNFLVDVRGGKATVFCYATASHYMEAPPSGGNTRTFVGSYDFALSRTEDVWRVDGFRFNLKYVDGNVNLGA
jgi:hypothetical protein